MEISISKISKLVAVVIITIGLGGCSGEHNDTKRTNNFDQSSGKVVAAYFPDWRIHEQAPYTPSQIPAGDLYPNDLKMQESARR